MIEKKVRGTVCAGDQVKRKSRVRFKLFNHAVAWKSNGVRVILKRKSM